jgi:hypothetical protein
MSSRLIWVGVALMTLSTMGCGLRGGESTPPRPDPTARELERRAFTPEGRRDIFVRQGLGFGGRTGPEVRTQLGVPDNVVVRPLPELGEALPGDSLLTWVYAGVEVDMVRSLDGRRVVTEARVRQDRHLRFPELRIGADTLDLLRVVGDPDARESGDEVRWVYRCGRCEAPVEPVHVRLQAGRIVGIDFFFSRF